MKLKLISKLEIDKIQVLMRLSKSKKYNKEPSEKLNSQINEMLSLADTLIDSRAIFEIIDVTNLPDREYFGDALKVAFAICTIGDRLPNKTVELLQNGELVKGVILDAIGSVAVESLADQINNEINNQTIIDSLVPSMRYSPGYCDTPLSDQDMIFEILQAKDNKELSIDLTEFHMMNPVKSVSFLVNIGINFVNRCKTCDRKKCPYRR